MNAAAHAAGAARRAAGVVSGHFGSSVYKIATPSIVGRDAAISVDSSTGRAYIVDGGELVIVQP